MKYTSKQCMHGHSCQVSRFDRTVPEFGPLSQLGPEQHLCPGMFKIFTYLELRVANIPWWLKARLRKFARSSFFEE